MPEGEEQTAARPGRCANHPAVALVGTCELCGRPVCIECAIPVRGRLIGPECLSSILEDLPPAQPLPRPIRPSGDRLAMVGFALVVILSVLPWSRFGDSSRYFGAWTFHWSLIAVVGGLGGLAVAVIGRYLSIDPRVEGSVYAVLAVVVAAAAILHYRHPPLLSDSTAWPLVAVVAAAVAGVGAALKWSALLSIRRHPA